MLHNNIMGCTENTKNVDVLNGDVTKYILQSYSTSENTLM